MKKEILDRFEKAVKRTDNNIVAQSVFGWREGNAMYIVSIEKGFDKTAKGDRTK